jgi:hypothetical protein
MALVVAGHLELRESPRDRHVASEVVGVRRPETADLHAGLGERHSALGVRMHDSAAAGKRAVELEVGRGVRGGAQAAADDLARGERDRHEQCRRELPIGDAVGLDQEDAPGAIDAGHVPERAGDQAACGQVHVRAVDLLAKARCRLAHAAMPQFKT